MIGQDFLLRCAAYCEAQGFPTYREPGMLNLLYVEGVDADGRENGNAADRFNDRRILWDVDESGSPRLRANFCCTTEPGMASTKAKEAKKNGGVFRIMFGWHPKAWVMGTHKATWHLALHQIPGAKVWGHRDLNGDGERKNDRVALGYGINQHSTGPRFHPTRVGLWSAGCLVGQEWVHHLWWINLLKTDPRYIQNPKFAWSTTVLDGTKIPQLIL